MPAHDPCALVQHAANTAETAAIGVSEQAKLIRQYREDMLGLKAMLRVGLYILGGTCSLILSALLWGATELRSQSEVNAKRAEIVAEATVLRADRRIEILVKQAAIEGGREALRAQQELVDRLVARAGTQ
jgi:hypothetical protein